MMSILPTAPPARRWLVAAEIGFVFCVFLVHGGWPAPEINEAHYLCKAKDFWDPDWVRGDFFLDSADAHLVFYWTQGWLTLLMPLSAVAWTGRVITWLLMAWAWRRLSWTLAPKPWFAVLSAALWVALCHRAHMAGEWVIGGYEAKGLAYVLVLLALERLAAGRWNLALLLLGAASSFHVLVGGWTVMACGVAWLFVGPSRPKLRSILPGLAGGLLLALPGLIPALALGHGQPAEMVRLANAVYVFRRLPHHLVPNGLGGWMIARHLALLAAWIVLYLLAKRLLAKRLPQRDGLVRLAGVVFGAVLIAECGFLIATLVTEPFLSAAIMRFYWFRMSDVLLPLGVALAAAMVIARLRRFRPGLGGCLIFAAMLLAGAHLGEVALRRVIRAYPPAESPRRVANFPHWLDVCRVIRQRTPRDAVFLTPRLAQTFKWRAERAEVVNYKDIPQDPRGIDTWWGRMKGAHKVHRRHIPRSLAAQGTAEVVRMAHTYRAQYVLTLARPPLKLRRLYANATYALYKVPPKPESK